MLFALYSFLPFTFRHLDSNQIASIASGSFTGLSSLRELWVTLFSLVKPVCKSYFFSLLHLSLVKHDRWLAVTSGFICILWCYLHIYLPKVHLRTQGAVYYFTLVLIFTLNSLMYLHISFGGFFFPLLIFHCTIISHRYLFANTPTITCFAKGVLRGLPLSTDVYYGISCCNTFNTTANVPICPAAARPHHEIE